MARGVKTGNMPLIDQVRITIAALGKFSTAREIMDAMGTHTRPSLTLRQLVESGEVISHKTRSNELVYGLPDHPKPDCLQVEAECPGCGCVYPKNTKFWPRRFDRKKSGHVRLRAICKLCYAEQRAEKKAQAALGYMPDGEEPEGAVMRIKTESGGTIVRFGTGWKPSRREHKSHEAMQGYASAISLIINNA